SSSTRSMYSTDASIYRVVPDIGVLPPNSDAVVAALDVAREYSLAMTARGGGTSMAGNSIGPGLVLDFSKYMNKVLHIDPENHTATVQPGVVLADLQQDLATGGLQVGAAPSARDRC